MLQWIFFDIGSVLFNDDPQNFRFYEFVHETLVSHGQNRSFAALMQERERRVLAGEQWISRKILAERLGYEIAEREFARLFHELHQKYDEYHLLQNQLHEILDSLKSRFKLGIIANQIPECRQSLVRRKLINYFDVIAISDELNLHKPDVELYSWALEQANVDSSKTLMIGDRPDNDIYPAQQLGMKTMLLHWENWDTKNWQPNHEHAQTFLQSCARTPMFSFNHLDIQPDRQVSEFQQIPTAIEQLVS